MREYLQTQIDTLHRSILARIRSEATPHPQGHAFLWANLPAKQKNGKTVYVLTYIGSVGSSDLHRAVDIAMKMGANNAYYENEPPWMSPH